MDFLANEKTDIIYSKIEDLKFIKLSHKGDRIDKYSLLWVMVCMTLDLDCGLTLALLVQDFLNVHQVHIPEQVEGPGLVFAQFLHGFCV